MMRPLLLLCFLLGPLRHPVGQIRGVKFEDLNGNGLKDTGEPGLAGWTINLTDKEYNEGSGGLSGGGFMTSAPRTWMLTNTLRF